MSSNLDEWYVGPLTKERIADLRFKLGKVRGLLLSFLDSDTCFHPSPDEISKILSETKD